MLGQVDASLARAASAGAVERGRERGDHDGGRCDRGRAPLTTKIKAATLTDPELKNTTIEVETKAGVVSLRGTVPSISARTRAERIAHETKGVASVDSHLIVQAPT